ncbi:aminotransferase class I/II-fold pyridoxal phosphate-dependent enzyme [Neptunomonas phycophila]|jgi:8-amino-7-oxononanoate synthase|uniref:Aminotransferase class I/II-fold pyridoxal phosphate-dependent enzyme n=1 Tax=Neptunomonas phycophila TaxID=1572645 RepID=A0AAW7XJV5_9GAMM|nr:MULTISPECIES: aminotransferase class I/II-fold pyridoxal phosphate-dependent enzyme [Neptunomonas]MDN2661237.1 aminotransferase class I/II-fold pyridoxal phosphate-dependent enzyme [Neptunomonas sp. CHC150]MDO6454521.1 aminotransferase class I/II-fold pyridoxal phosphate-dependent enzyme [Neptunomonas phycophila]MDP2521879.1 aminotransferase class I/II-fold pyridoxal phosphate-dependent enzyme [Neptunomonas phycophila]QLE96798.1 aminotransferase class I/II-fold pyridoxal phosphate-dependent 
MSSQKLSQNIKDKLIQKTLQHKLKKAENSGNGIASLLKSTTSKQAKANRFDQHPGYQQMQIIKNGAASLGIESPFFRTHEGVAGATSVINGKEVINYASYNYLGLSGHPKVNQAAVDAIEQYGTSVSASRIVSGERPIHQALEAKLAHMYEVDDALAFVSGHATNVTTIGYLFGAKDLIIHDEYIHNSSIVGAQLSGAKRLSFPHNDLDALEALLAEKRHQFERVLIVVEGLYSMDGDHPDLARLVEIKQQHYAFLMVDEAHSFGILGDSGKGLRELYQVAGKDVDIWMGTLSKTMSGCGGYIAGESALIEHLRYMAPGFLYSVGMPAPIAAAALASLEVMEQEPERIHQLMHISKYFLDTAKSLGFNTGESTGIAVIPIILGSSVTAAKASAALFEKGINVQPILYPAVPEQSARLRFFLSCEHTEAQVRETLVLLKTLI